MSLLRQIRLLTLRSIRARSLRFLLSAFGIVLGVAGMLAIGVTNKTALNSIVKLFENTSGRTKLTVTSANQDATGFPEQAQRTIGNVAGVSVAAPIVRALTVTAEEATPDQLAFGLFGTSSSGSVQVYGIDPLLDRRLRDYTLTAGKFLGESLTAREIVLVENYAEDQEVSVGDWFSIVTPNGIEQLKIIGLMAREGPGQTNNGSFGVIPIGAAQELFNRDGQLDQVDILTTDPSPPIAQLDELKALLQTRLGRDLSVTYPSSQGERMTQMLQNYQIGLNFMSGIALFVGAFLIYNAFAMTVVERTREFGMLRTIGMTRGQVTGLVLLEASVLGIFGSLAGLGMGMLLARGLTRLMETVLNQPLGTVDVPAVDMFSSWLIGFFVTMLAAGIPAWQAGRISPMEALRVRGKSGEGWLIRRGWILGLVLLVVSTIVLIANPFPYDVQFRLGSMTVFGLFGGATLLIPGTVAAWEQVTRPVMKWIYGASGSLGSRNVRRSRQRTTLTVAALMVGVAMVIMTRGMTESFAGDLKEWMAAYIGGDIYASSSIPMRSDIGRRIESVPGVQAVAPIRYLTIDWQTPNGSEEIQFMGIEPVAYTRVTKFVFSASNVNVASVIERLQQGDAVLISSVLSEKYVSHAPSGLHFFQRSAQQAASQGAPGDQTQPIVAAGGNHFQFDGAVVEVVDALFADQSHHPAFGSLLAGGGDVPTGKIARTDINHFALVDQAVKSLPGFIPGAVAVDMVHLVQVDPIGLEAFQAALTVFADFIGRQAAPIAVDFFQVGFARNRVVHLCCQHGGVTASAALGKPAPDDFFGMTVFHAPAIDIRCVEEVDPQFKGAIHDFETLFFAGLPAEVHGAQAQVADQHAMPA